MKPALLWTLAALTAQAQWVSPKLRSEHREIHNVLILPADINLQLESTKGSRGLPGESDQVAGVVYSAISEELTARGASVLPNPLLAASTDEARFAIVDLQRRFDTAAMQLFRKPRGLERGRYTLGDGVSGWPPAASADTLVFIRGSGNLLSFNKEVFDWITLRPLLSSFNACVTFVDARSGEIIGLTRLSLLHNVTHQPEDALRKAVRKASRNLPLPIAIAPPASETR